MEEDPKQGVTVKLVDGTVKKVKAGDVKSVEYGAAKAAEPAPQAGTTQGTAPVVAPPLAPVAPSSPYGPPPAHRRRSERRSTGLLVTGLVLMPLGAIAIGTGVAIGVVNKGYKHDAAAPGIALLIGGGTFLLTGLVFTIVGGSHKSSDDDEALAPRVQAVAGPGSFGFRGAF